MSFRSIRFQSDELRQRSTHTVLTHTHTHVQTQLWQHVSGLPVQVSFAPPSWDAPDLRRAPPLPSLANFVYLNVFCAAATAAQFWGWSFMSFAFKWNFMDQRGLIADPGSALPPMKCFLWIWIWVLVVGPSEPMPHLQHTHTHHTMHTACASGIHKTDIPFVVLEVFKCILIYLVLFLPNEIHVPSISKRLLLPP